MAEFTPKPAGITIKSSQGYAWCPYCGLEAPFGWDKKLNVARCLGCGISSREFYIRRENGLNSREGSAAFQQVVKTSGRRFQAEAKGTFQLSLPFSI